MPPPATSKQHVSSYQIKVGGPVIDKAFSDAVREVRVVSSLGAPDVCTLKIGLSVPRKKGEKHPIDSMPFEVGKVTEIRLGEKEGRAPTTLFKGKIVTVEPTFGAGGVQILVRALDPSYVLFRGRRTRAFQNQTVGDIVQKVCGDAKVNVTVGGGTGGALDYMLQANETDWEFVHRLAERIGFEFAMTDAGAKFGLKKQDGMKGSAPEIKLEYPKEIFQYAPRLTATQQVDAVELRAWDHKTKAVLKANASKPDTMTQLGIKRDAVHDAVKGGKMLIATEPVADADHAKRAAQSLLDRMGDQHAAAEGLTAGNPAIKAGAVLKIEGVGKNFGAKLRCHTVTHVLRGGGTYETHFASGSANTIASALRGAGGSGPSGSVYAEGLVIGVVTNNSDPDDMGRVKVKFPTLEDQESAWAPVVTPSAGKERGLMMLPIAGEQVLVAFEHNDISRPIVIGSMFNGKEKPGKELAATDGSYGLRSDKKIITRAKEEIELEGGKTYTLKMGGDVKETFSAKLTTTVSGDVMLESQQGKITVKALQDIEISSQGGNVTIKGMMVKIDAQANLDLSATGITSVKGSMINLG